MLFANQLLQKDENQKQNEKRRKRSRRSLEGVVEEVVDQDEHFIQTNKWTNRSETC